jgi:hypothetical protein
MKKLFIFLSLMLAAGCGDYEGEPSEEDKQIADMQNRIDALQGTVDQINDMDLSDFATCTGTNTSDALIKKICQVAKASTVEAMVSMKGELAAFAKGLQEQINNINLDVVALAAQQSSDVTSINAQISSINTQISTINVTLASLDTRMTTAESAITALQNLTASINGTLSGVTTSFEVGNENVSAGPLFETFLKHSNGSKYIAYIDAYSTAITVGNNPLTSVNNSSTVTVTTSVTHGLVVGDTVKVSGATSSRGFTLSQLNTSHSVASVPTATTFTITLTTNATSGGSLGGASVVLKEYLGSGLGVVWEAGDGDDVAVRTTSLGSKVYNFIMVEDNSSVGHLCYDKTNNAANFATLSNVACQTNGVATGNCACK